MESVITVSLNGYPYSLTGKAYLVLRGYLDALINRFGQSSEAQETLEAIEARLGELLSEQKKADAPLTENDINAAIAILGQPEDIDAPQEGQTTSSSRQYSEENAERIRNRMQLYRDADHKIISGVCAGIAARTNTNVAVIRLLFLIAFFIYGAGLFAYIILWAAVPAARTPLQKLRMKGKPITIDTIRAEANRTYQAARDALKGKRHAHPHAASPLQSLGAFFTIVSIGIVKLIAKILGIAIIIGSAAVALTISVLLLLTFLGEISPSEYFYGDETNIALLLLGWDTTPRMVALAIWGFCIIPLGALFLIGLRIFLNFRIAKTFSIIMIAIWIGSILTLAVLLPVTKWRANRYISGFDNEYTIPMRANDTLRIDVQAHETRKNLSPHDYFAAPRIIIRSTDDSTASVRISFSTISQKDAPWNDQQHEYAPIIDTASAILPIVQSTSEKRDASIPFNAWAIIYLPEGTLIKVTSKAASKAEGYTERRTIRGKTLSKSVWQMRNGYLAPPSLPTRRAAPTPTGHGAMPSTHDSLAIETTTAI